VEFNLIDNSYKPYRKPNNDPVYLNKQSNHPSSVLNQLPASINRRISELSSNLQIYQKEILPYREALSKSGFIDQLSFNPPETRTAENEVEKEEKKKRKRKIIWFNPPFSANVKTQVGRIFLKLVKTHFHRNHQFHKIFNANTVKMSYSSMKNMDCIISSHNKKLLNPKTDSYGCNCRTKANCPLQNKCLTPCIVYETSVKNNTNTETKRYIGLSETPFKTRYSNHLKDFKHNQYKKNTELSKYVWELKDQAITPSITWKIIKNVNSKTQSNYCKLCLYEKLYIMDSLDDTNLLNKKSEFVNACRHQSKLLIKSAKKNGVG